MIKLFTSKDLDAFQRSMNVITTDNYSGNLYIEEELLPAVLLGDWSKLSKMVIYSDEKKTIYFYENNWNFLDSDIKAKSINNLCFGISDSLPENVQLLGKAELQLINELKKMGSFQHEIATRLKYRNLFKNAYSVSDLSLSKGNLELINKLENFEYRRKKEQE